MGIGTVCRWWQEQGGFLTWHDKLLRDIFTSVLAMESVGWTGIFNCASSHSACLFCFSFVPTLMDGKCFAMDFYVHKVLGKITPENRKEKLKKIRQSLFFFHLEDTSQRYTPFHTPGFQFISEEKSFHEIYFPPYLKIYAKFIEKNREKKSFITSTKMWGSFSFLLSLIHHKKTFHNQTQNLLLSYLLLVFSV